MPPVGPDLRDGLDADAEVCRLTVCPSLEPFGETTIRVSRHQDSVRVDFSAQWLGSKSAALTIAAWDRLSRAMERSDFWRLAPEPPQGLDGTDFVIDACRNGLTHQVVRCSPRSGPFFELCQILAELGRVAYQPCDVLRLFNRKERNLLVRAVLGQKHSELRLAEAFRAEVADQLGIGIPADAWWATDFHINWLAAALAIYCEGDARLNQARANVPQPLPATGPRLVTGSQEDVDLVIATGEHLIMIEAKGYEPWSNSQLASKLARLELLHAEHQQLAALFERTPLRFHLLLMSPTKPTKLKKDMVWPRWAVDGVGRPRWLCMDLPPSNSILTVERCDEHGTVGALGDAWRISKFGL